VALTGTAATGVVLTVSTTPIVNKSFVTLNVAVGGTTTMNITVQNTNATAMTGAAFTDTYPAGLTGALTATAAPAGCTGTLTAAAGSLALTGGTIPATTTCTYSVVVTGATAGAKLNSTGPVTTTNAGTGTAATATLNVYTPPTVSKSFAPSTIPLSGIAAMTLTVTNPPGNPGAVSGISIRDVFPTTPGAMTLANTTVINTCAGSTETDSAGGGLNTGDAGVWVTGISLAAGASCAVTFNVKVSAVGGYTNTTDAITATTPVALSGATANAALTVTTGGIVVTKTVTTLCDPFDFNVLPKAIPGAYVRYEIRIENTIGAAVSATLTTIGDVLDPNLNFDADLRSGSAGACASSAPESALGRGFKLTCAGGTRACNAPVYFTSAADTDAVGISGSNITLTFGNGPAGTKALPTEAGYAAGELKPGESVTIRFNAIVK
jgi:hypothetical protein